MAVSVVMNVSAHEDRRTEIELNLLLEGSFQLYKIDFRVYERKLMAERVIQFSAQHAWPSISVLLTRILNESAFAILLVETGL
jgi:hypothetical protein